MTRSRKSSRPEDIARIVSTLRAVITGTTPRSAVAELTREFWPPGSGQGTPFPGNGTATAVFDSIWNIEETVEGQYLVRDADLVQFIKWLLEGFPTQGTTRIAWVKGTPAQFGAALGVPTVRSWVDGLGWHETLSFASPYTGRCFVGNAPMAPVTTEPVVDIMAYGPADVASLHDLFDTLVIDSDDLFQPPDFVFRRWQLWRQDENGVRAMIAAFTGRAKAEAALIRFETLGHKQSFWLEALTNAG